ncbi:MAG: GTPase [Ruminococcaceae bacterium]|nr:GTPase [Oscillospiraceae bacterium]
MARDMIPVYLFTGFLESGKTKFIQESMEDKKFNSGDKTLLLVCEEGIEEYDPSSFWGQNVYFAQIENEEDLTEENLTRIANEHMLDRIIIEYNGIWQLPALYAAMPKNWAIYQQMFFVDGSTFLTYNANMRSLVVDKLNDAEMVIFNRADSPNVDKEQFHKIVRGINRRSAIIYDYPDGKVEYDEIEDPLPFDKNAPVIEIGDDDYALWYRDLSEDLEFYIGKTVKFKGMVARSPELSSNSFIIGRPIMTCCADDIAYSGLVCRVPSPTPLRDGEWVTVKAKISYENCNLYKKKGPVLTADGTSFAVKPQNEVATFY